MVLIALVISAGTKRVGTNSVGTEKVGTVLVPKESVSKVLVPSHNTDMYKDKSKSDGRHNFYRGYLAKNGKNCQI